MSRSCVRLAAGIALAAPSLAVAQGANVPEGSVYDGDYLTVGVGAGYGPSYDGSDDYVVYPAPLVQGRLGGIELSPRAGGAALDLIPDRKGAKVGWSLGPVLRVRFERTGRIKDPVVRSLGELDTAAELGGNAGVTVYDLFTGYDSVTASADVRWDVAGAHEGMVVAPSLSYFTPVSQGVAVSLSLSAEHVDDHYADYYATVTPAGAAASGLPAFQADGGWKSVGPTLLIAADLGGDLTDGGFVGFLLGGYSRMLGDFKRTPLTSVRGDADQWVVGAGVGYTF